MMRKFKLLALALLIGSASLFANNDNPEVPKKVIRDQIATLLSAPDFTVSQEMTVNVTFTFNSEGEIVVLSVDSKNKEILSYIRKNLNNKKVETPGTRDKHYMMPLKVQEG